MLQSLTNHDLDAVSGAGNGHAYGKVAKLIIGNNDTDSFNTGGVYIKAGKVTITVGSDSTLQIGSNGGLLSNNSVTA